MSNVSNDTRKMSAEKLRDMLSPIQESKGYYFNLDEEITLEILGQMLGLKENYGYLVCPCRLSSGDRECDKDIFCPCVYREADVGEYGFCYCGLYTSKDVHDRNSKRVVVPERRPAEKTLAALGIVSK